MADTVLKFPDEKPNDEKHKPIEASRSLVGMARQNRRMILLVVIPLIAAVVGLGFYLAGGRYITTNNAYVGAPKVLITPDISGKISRVAIKEGQRVAAGDELVSIDPQPFTIAVIQAEARLAGVRTDYLNLKSNIETLGRQIALARDSVAIRQSDVDRKTALVATRAVSPADVDLATWNLMGAKTQLEQLLQQEASARNQLLGDVNLPIEKFPPFQQANAALDQAKRDLAHTTIRAPIAGTATQVDNVQLGRYIAAGTPMLSVIDDANPWVDANPKETDITHLKVGQRVSIDVDTFPNHTFRGTVVSVSPGTGAQFAILPPQNASGNWVKVVQRVPVRIVFDKTEDTSALRSGMSANVEIDTERKRSIATLFGFGTATATAAKP